MAGETHNTEDEVYGIVETLAGYVIESVNDTETPQIEPVPDQKNKLKDEIQYDTRIDLRLTVRGKNKPSAGILDFDNKKWAVDSVEKAGIYNGLRRWNITAHRTDDYPGTKTARTQA